MFQSPFPPLNQTDKKTAMEYYNRRFDEVIFNPIKMVVLFLVPPLIIYLYMRLEIMTLNNQIKSIYFDIFFSFFVQREKKKKKGAQQNQEAAFYDI